MNDLRTKVNVFADPIKDKLESELDSLVIRALREMVPDSKLSQINSTAVLDILDVPQSSGQMISVADTVEKLSRDLEMTVAEVDALTVNMTGGMAN